MTTIQELERIASELRKVGGNTRTIVDRRAGLFKNLCEKAGIKYISAGYKPGGKSCTIAELSDRYRVFIRCGYGRYNYAPCFEIMKF